MVAPIYRLARGGEHWNLPPVIKVASLVLNRAGHAPLYVRSLNNKCSICVAATDDGNWVGFVMARWTKDVKDVSEDGAGVLCFAKATDLLNCAEALGEAVTTGLSMADTTPAGKRAFKRLQDDKNTY